MYQPRNVRSSHSHQKLGDSLPVTASKHSHPADTTILNLQSAELRWNTLLGSAALGGGTQTLVVAAPMAVTTRQWILDFTRGAWSRDGSSFPAFCAASGTRGEAGTGKRNAVSQRMGLRLWPQSHSRVEVTRRHVCGQVGAHTDSSGGRRTVGPPHDPARS